MSQQFRHIAIIGKMHSGKSTLARLLVEDHGFTRIGLADAVKDDCAEFMNHVVNLYKAHGLRHTRIITRRTIDDYKSEFRPLLQWYGTEFWREFMERPNHWIEAFVERAELAPGPVVCDDVRFVNEATALWDAGFMVVKIVRPEALRSASAGEQGIKGHPSEMEQDGIMPYLTVPNDKGLDDLRGHAETLAEMIEDGGAWALPMTYLG